MVNKDAKEFAANLPDADKADLIAVLLNGAEVDAKVQVVDCDDTVTIPLARYDNLIKKATILDLMISAKKSDGINYLSDELLTLLAGISKK